MPEKKKKKNKEENSPIFSYRQASYRKKVSRAMQ
jgi:hypothetical protein